VGEAGEDGLIILKKSMQKLSFDEWKNSMSFMIDDKFDRTFLQSIETIAKFINSNCRRFPNPKELSKFLSSKEDFSALQKLKAFISLIGLSEERLKRVVSLVRYKYYSVDFRSEWDVKMISKAMQEDADFSQSLVEFFIYGRDSKIGADIPLYYMRNFKLKDSDFIKDLQNYNYVERILNDNEIQGKYSNEVGAHVEKIIEQRLEKFKAEKNPSLKFEIQKEFPLLNKNVDFLIPNVTAPLILIESSYNITTGSAQSKRADQLVEFFGILLKHNANHRKNKILMLNYCDGFGWVGRQNDLSRIYDASHFVFNQKTLPVLDDVLTEYYPSK
jgi:DpnII restriction endonuclease